MFLKSLLFVLAASVLATGAWAQTDEQAPEENSPTPLSDFAPDELRPERGQSYDEGITVQDISIEGNRLVDENQIKEAMSVRPGSLYSKRALQSDLRRIYDMGYFTDRIKAVPIATSNGVKLRIVVEENAPVTGVNVEGNTLIKPEEIQAVFAKQTGMPQNIGQLNEAIEKIEGLYADKGYILARVKSIKDDPDGVINLEITEGEIAQVQFVGNRKTKDSVVRRNLTVKEGQVYNEKRVSDDLRRLYSTGAFSDVRRVITANPDAPDRYNLTLELDEKKTGAISLGGGVDTGTGLFGSVGFNDPNFLGRGQQVNAAFAMGSGIIFRDDSQARARNYQFDVGWSTPRLFDTNNAVSVNGYGRDLASFNVPLGIERRIGAEATWSRPITQFKNMAGVLSLRGENVRLRDWASDARLAEFGIGQEDRRRQLEGGTFISLSPTVAFDTRDNRFNPTRGWFNTVSLTGAYGLGADSYSTASVNLRKYIKVRDGVTLALNTSAGRSLLGDIPDFNMFRMGGSQTVRGFQEGGLGIGNGFLTASAELRTPIPFVDKLKSIPLANSLSAAFFADAGTLFRESSLNNFFDRDGFGASVGAGIRFNIPGVGPIRVDYAIPITGGNSDFYRRFNFGVGQKF